MFKQLTPVVLLLLVGVHHGVNGLPQSKVKRSSSRRTNARRRLTLSDETFTSLLQDVCDEGPAYNWDLAATLAAFTFDYNNTATPTLLTGDNNNKLLISFITASTNQLDVLDEIVGDQKCTFHHMLGKM